MKDAVEQEEDSGMNQLFPNNGFILALPIIFYSVAGVLIKAGRAVGLAVWPNSAVKKLPKKIE